MRRTAIRESLKLLLSSLYLNFSLPDLTRSYCHIRVSSLGITIFLLQCKCICFRSHSSKSNVGAIAGGAVGGAIVLCLVAVGITVCLMRRKRQNDSLKAPAARPTSMQQPMIATPFVGPSTPNGQQVYQNQSRPSLLSQSDPRGSYAPVPYQQPQSGNRYSTLSNPISTTSGLSSPGFQSGPNPYSSFPNNYQHQQQQPSYGFQPGIAAPLAAAAVMSAPSHHESWTSRTTSPPATAQEDPYQGYQGNLPPGARAPVATYPDGPTQNAMQFDPNPVAEPYQVRTQQPWGSPQISHHSASPPPQALAGGYSDHMGRGPSPPTATRVSSTGSPPPGPGDYMPGGSNASYELSSGSQAPQPAAPTAVQAHDPAGITEFRAPGTFYATTDPTRMTAPAMTDDPSRMQSPPLDGARSPPPMYSPMQHFQS